MMIGRKTALPALIALVFLSLVWGYNWVVMKEAMRYSDPLSFSAIRSFCGGLVLLAAVLLTQRSASIGSFWGVLGLGFIQTTVFVTLSIWALVYGGAGRTAVLVYTMPLWLLIMAWPILGEKLRGWQWAAVGLTLVGLSLILQPWKLAATPIGALLAVISAVTWATAGVWAKLLRKRVRVDLLALTGWQLLLGSIPLVAVTLAFPSRPIEWHPTLVAAVVYNIGPATAVAWLLWLYALDRLPAPIAGMGTLMTPMVGVLSAWLQLGERPGGSEKWGMVLIFLGLAAVVWEQLRSKQ